jgi:monoterpene epsilon-lactone hydrolase
MRFDIPSTISNEAGQALRQFYSLVQLSRERSPAPKPVTVEEWDLYNAQLSALVGQLTAQAIGQLDVGLRDDVIAGVPVVRFTPGQCQEKHLLIYLHGGGYTLFSPKTVATLPALLALATECEVLAIDYTLAPRGNWQSVTSQVESVYRAVLETGRSAGAIGFFGDSAGGGLACGSILRLRDQGLPLPGAVVLMSPWCDLTGQGDSVRTLGAADPTLAQEDLALSAAAYAPTPEDRRHPYASPINGDYTRPVSPMLIQAGTREILLSDAVRLYQAVAGGGGMATLDIYEGMPHVFQSMVPFAPESRTAIRRAARFFEDHLRAPSSAPLS